MGDIEPFFILVIVGYYYRALYRCEFEQGRARVVWVFQINRRYCSIHAAAKEFILGGFPLCYWFLLSSLGYKPAAAIKLPLD